MTSYLLPFTQGTISIVSGESDVTATGAPGLANNCLPGDTLQIGLSRFTVGSGEITDGGFPILEEFAGYVGLDGVWVGGSLEDAPYRLHKTSSGWGDATRLTARNAELMTALERGYVFTSLTPIEIGSGEHTFTVTSLLTISAGAVLRFSSRAGIAGGTHFIIARVKSFDGQSLVVEAQEWDGEGDIRSDWNINLSGSVGPQGLSAYQQAVAGGFEGDLAAWLVSLDGDDGDNGWTPVLAVVEDGERRVLQIADWVGGEGSKPTTGEYVGLSGLVATPAEAVDIGGPRWITSQGVWEAGTYPAGSGVHHGGNYYRATVETSEEPPHSDWELIAEGGDDGEGVGDVTAASAFGTDNVLVRADGTGKGVQATGLSVDDSDNLSGVNNVTGADADFVTGSAGTDGNLVAWNGDGDAVDSGYSVSSIISAAVDAVRDGVVAAFDTLSEIAAALAGKLPKDGSEAMTGPLVLTEAAAPGTPAAGTLALYAKDDSKLYTKDETGAETEVGSGSSGAASGISYDNGTSDLEADNVQDAIDEIAGRNMLTDFAVSLLPDSGRFAGNDAKAVSVTSYSFPSYMTAYNSTSHTSLGKFITNNNDYGGSAGALNASIKDLIDKIRDSSFRRFGLEFFVSQLTMGAGTASTPINYGGVDHYFSLFLTQGPRVPAMTWHCYLRAIDDDIIYKWFAGQTIIKEGVRYQEDVVIEPADGWVSITVEDQQDPYQSFGYNPTPLNIYAVSGDKYQMACPALMGGITSIDDNIGVIAGANRWL